MATAAALEIVDIDAESAVIGSCLLDSAAADRALAALEPADFHDVRHAQAFAAIAELRHSGGAVDEVTVAGRVAFKGAGEYLSRLTETTPTAANVDHYAAIVRDHAHRRWALEALRKAAREIERGDAAAWHENIARLLDGAGKVRRAPTAFPVRTYSGKPAAPRWLVRGLIEQGTCVVIAAEPKAGKTWLTFDLGIALAAGQKFLGWQPAEPGVTLYYSPEGGHRSRLARVAGLCWGRQIDHDKVLPSMPFLDARLDLSQPDHAQRLAMTIDETKARLVVIDPLVSAHVGVDENSAGDVMRILSPLRDIITARPHCSLVLVHHTGKGAGDRSRNLGLRGSSAIDGWWDTLITVRRADDDSGGPRRVDIAHRDAEAPAPMGFELSHSPDNENGGLQWFRLSLCEAPEISRGGKQAPPSNDSLDERIDECLADGKPRSANELHRTIRGNRQRLLARLRDRASAGTIAHTDRGFQAVPAGREPA